MPFDRFHTKFVKHILKKQILEENGYNIRPISIGGSVTPFNRQHLESKKNKLGHEGIFERVIL